MTDDARSSDLGRQITALTEVVGALATTVSELRDRVKHLDKANKSREQNDTSDSHEPAAWVWFSPPAAAEDDPDTTDDPQTTVDNFVTWYNITYVGIEGSRAQPISRLLAATPRPGDGSRYPRLQLARSQHRALNQTTRCAVLASSMATRLHRSPAPRVDPRGLPR